MIVACDCGAKLKIDDAKVGEKGTKIRCPRCATVLTVHREPAPAASSPSPTARPSRTAGTPRAAAGGPVVLVAHENESVRQMVAGVLAEGGIAVELAADGVEALHKATERKPEVALIDVGLPGIYVFELCERLREAPQTSNIKIILLTSVYDVARYKRSPVSFYGADDYIEKHEIAGTLVQKVRALVTGREQPRAPVSAVGATAPRPAPAADEDLSGFFREVVGGKGGGTGATYGEGRSWPGDSLPPSQDSAAVTPESFSLDSSVFDPAGGAVPAVEERDPEAVEKAKRLARIIVSDIALYNQEAVIEGVRSGTFFDLLREDVEEGRRLYDERVPASIRAGRDYYQEAFDNFIAAQKKIHR